MRIDIITLHRVRNYGSSLQTLALQNKLVEKGCDVEIIDYYPERYTSLGLLKRLKYKSKRLEKNPVVLLAARMIISVSYIRKKIIFDGFLKRNLKITSKIYRSEEELIANCPQADVYCTGSDQVWNSHWNEGIDYPFYLTFIPEGKMKFSYGSSFGNGSIDKAEVETVKKFFKSYKYLSVRENTGVDIFNSLGFEDVCQVLDPTLLMTEKDWKPYVSDRYKTMKYVVTYNLHHDPKIDRFANELARAKGIKVFNISYNLHDIYRKGQLKWCPTVEEYLGLVKYAQYVVTDSFHATVFSLVFGKKFIAIYPELASSRISSLLELVGLEERGIIDYENIAIIDADIDYRKVNETLSVERDKAMIYLDRVLTAC